MLAAIATFTGWSGGGFGAGVRNAQRTALGTTRDRRFS